MPYADAASFLRESLLGHEVCDPAEGGNPAKHAQRLIASEDLIVVGAEGMYEARCRRCFEPNLAAEESKKKKRARLATTAK